MSDEISPFRFVPEIPRAEESFSRFNLTGGCPFGEKDLRLVPYLLCDDLYQILHMYVSSRTRVPPKRAKQETGRQFTQAIYLHLAQI